MRVNPMLRSMHWLVALVLLGSGCRETTKPESSSGLQPGRYVLTTIDGASLPFELERNSEGNVTVTGVVVFDTITVIDDSTAMQSFRRATMVATDGGPPEETASQEFRGPRKVYPRDDEFALVAPLGLQVPNPVYVSVRGNDLIQLFRATTLPCVRPACQGASRTVLGRYVRR